MSVVLKFSTEMVILICKGAPETTLDRCVDIHKQKFDVNARIEDYRRRGYNVMVLAKVCRWRCVRMRMAVEWR